MAPGWRAMAVALALVVAAAFTAAGPAEAIEYRLLVVNLYEGAFASFMTPGEWTDGAAGAGLARLEASLDRGDIGSGNLIYDRHVQPASERQARAYGAVPAAAEVALGGGERGVWDEVRWEGQPGEQTAWLVRATSRLPQALIRTALKGAGPLRQFQPYAVPGGTKVAAARIPLSYLSFGEERGTLWQKDLASRLDLSQRIGIVVGLNDNLSFPDNATIITSHAAEPTTYKAVIVWRLRDTEQQAPGRGIQRIHR
jgi:hypothetical protein